MKLLLLSWALAAPALLLSAPGGGARLEAISARADARATTILIQASEPVAYATSQPDPLTVLVDLRNASAGGVVNRVAATRSELVSAVTVEDATADDGIPLARVRLCLATPAEPRVRSSRNVIQVDIARPAVADASAAANAPAPAKTGNRVLQAVRASGDAAGPSVALIGDGPLEPSTVTLIEEPPTRLVLDFPGVVSTAPKATAVGLGAVERVRVAPNSVTPLVTRVVFDLTRPGPYRIEPNGRELRVHFDNAAAASSSAPPAETPVDPIAALQLLPREDQLTEAPPALAGQGASAVSPAAPAVPPAALAVPQAAPAGASVAPPVTASLPDAPAAAGPDLPVAPPASVGPPVAVAPPVAPAETQSAPAAPAAPQQQPPASQQTAAAAAPAGQQAAAPEGEGQAAPGPKRVSIDPVFVAQGEKQYTGFPVSLDFGPNADLRVVLRTFSEISGLNIVIDPATKGSVDVSLRDVPWDQALDIILRANQLGHVVDGSIVRIAPLTVLAEEEAQRRRLADEQMLAGDLGVMTKTLSYARADNLRPLIEKSAISRRGQVQVDPRTNTIIIRDIAASLDIARTLIETLDKPEPQVEIEARIVQTTRNYARELGAQLGISGRVLPALGNTTPLAFPNQGSITGRNGVPQGGMGDRAVPSAVNLPVQKAEGAGLGITLGSVNGAFNLDVALSALEKSGRARLLSTPRVSTQNNIEAEIMQGVQIPIQIIANNTVTVFFKDAALTLRVTPQITANNTVIMKIFVENASPDYTKQINNIPPIDTQRAQTQVLINDGETLVLGGIYLSHEQSQADRVPGLHKLPLLGRLFRRDIIDDVSTELLIFITTKIIQ